MPSSVHVAPFAAVAVIDESYVSAMAVPSEHSRKMNSCLVGIAVSNSVGTRVGSAMGTGVGLNDVTPVGSGDGCAMGTFDGVDVVGWADGTGGGPSVG